MDINEHMKPDKLEYYSFVWSEARLLIAAVALAIGGVPVLRAIFPIPAFYSLIGLVLTVSWLISGAVSAYLLYRWVMGGKLLFGKKDNLDLVAFMVNVVTGFNLGYTGLIGTNIGMSMVPMANARVIFGIAAIVYIGTAIYLYRRWDASGKRIFSSAV